MIGEISLYKNLKLLRVMSGLIWIKFESARWRHNRKIPKRSIKSIISSLQILTRECFGWQKKQKGSRNSNLLSNCTVFQPKLNKLWKRIKNSFFHCFWLFKKGCLCFIQFCLKNSAISHQIWVPWSFLLLLPPKTFAGEDL